MSTISLDDFVLRLQTAAGLAQDALAARERSRVARDLLLDGQSNVEAETWCLKVDMTPPGGGAPRTVSIPFATLYNLGETKITQFRVETTATVEAVPSPVDPAREELQLRIGPPKSRRERLHNLVIDIFGVRFEKAEVRINDRILRVFGFRPGEREGRPQDGQPAAAPPRSET